MHHAYLLSRNAESRGFEKSTDVSQVVRNGSRVTTTVWGPVA